MNILFLNKNRPLMSLDLDPKTSYVKEILNIYDIDAMPIAMYSDRKDTLAENFTDWWKERAIPATRRAIREKLEEIGYHDIQEIINRSLGLSLSDQYWIKPLDSDLGWKDVNYFTNSFSSSFGKYLIGEINLDDSPDFKLNFHSPDITSNGDVQKRWEMCGEEQYLLKTGTFPYMQEPFNEYIASELLRCMSVPFVEYELIDHNGNYFSSCKDFIDENHEFVPAYYICQALHPKKKIHTEDLLHQAIDRFEIPNTSHFLDQMIMLDYLIMNVDRHWTNFGFIRNVETLQFEGPAPIFDNGNSLWFNQSYIPEFYDRALTFRSKHEKQIHLVKSFQGIDWHKIEYIPERTHEILSKDRHISEDRALNIAKHLLGRIKSLKKIRDRANGNVR